MTGENRALRSLAALTAAMVVVLIIAGGLVTTTETGDTIPTWPHWRGRLRGGMWIEMSHRFLGMLVGLLSLALAVLVQRRGASPAARRAAWIAFAGVAVQGLLGALRVRFAEAGLPQALTAIVHAVFAQVVFCAVVAVALLHSASWSSRGAGEARGAGLAATAAAFLQLVVGAVARHLGIGFEAHVLGAVAVLVFASILASRLLMTPLRRGAWLLTGLLLGQIALGIFTWILTPRTEGFVRSPDASVGALLTVSLHVATGAGLLASCWSLALLSGRPKALEARAVAA